MGRHFTCEHDECARMDEYGDTYHVGTNSEQRDLCKPSDD